MENDAPAFSAESDDPTCIKLNRNTWHQTYGYAGNVTCAATTTSTSISFPQSVNSHSPCLPVSKGYIKKTAQTRFVNSSPRSYRLMPASVESSDRTSFVEKSSHSNCTPMKFMLEVAELWEVSKRSELECNFTLAKSKANFGSDRYIEEAMTRSPICHSEILPTKIHKRKKRRHRNADVTESFARVGMGRKLMATVKSFFGIQELKDQFPHGIAGIINQEFCGQAGDLWLLNFVEGAQESSNQSDNSDDADGACVPNCNLTPLVKRLSVSGFDENDSQEKTVSSISLKHKIESGASGKAQTPIKRPNSSPITGCDEEPVQKRAFCNNSFKDKPFKPG